MSDSFNNLLITVRAIGYYAAWAGSIWAIAYVLRPVVGCM